MGANSNTFLHIRDAEVNAENVNNQQDYSQIDSEKLYRLKSGKVVREVNFRGRIRFCQYPKSENVYPFNKSDLEIIYDKEEKIKAFKLFQ
jgi:hypothetical protein